MLVFAYICFSLILSIRTLVIPRAAQTQPEYRLPQNAKPSLYEIELTLASDVFDTTTFSGVSILHFNANNTQEIHLHVNGLKISETKLVNAQGQEVALGNDASNYEVNQMTELMKITTKEVINGDYKFTFKYVGLLRTNEMNGFYKSFYKRKDGTFQPLATTQFEATSARRVFPCFDEPSFKAQFNVTLRYPKQYNALGNTPGTTQPDPENANYKITKFEKTPIMSTYTLAFIVSDFTCDKAPQVSVPHQICSKPSAASSRAYALEVGPKLLTALEQFTGIKYTESGISKIDHIAIPDFEAGAMENWGLATYREITLLYDKDHSSNKNKQTAAGVLAHELTHMWFGNLVTTHWWSDTFLNEGFAAFLQYFITAQVETSWELDKQFNLEGLHKVLKVDSGYADPLSHPVLTPAQINGRFSGISYTKGGCVIRMVQHFLGKDHFKSKINKYLTTYKFKNAKPVDLWTSLGENAKNLPKGQDLNSVMENWITQSGYPLLQVASNGNNVVITQKRYVYDNSIPKNSKDWYVPISYTKSTDSNKFQDTSTKVWLTPGEPVTLKDALVNDGWLILNNQQMGYYRVNYEDTIWARIFKALNNKDFEGIHVLNRAQLVDDYYNLAKAGLHSYSQFLDFISFLKKDSSYFPWAAAIDEFQEMLTYIGNKNIRASFSKYVLSLIETLYKKYQFSISKNDDQIFTLSRVLGLNTACQLGLEDCIKNSVAAFENYKKTGIKPDKNLRLTIYCSALRHSKNANVDWNFLWQEYKNSDLGSEQVSILTALGCVQDTKILTDYLNKIIDTSSGIRRQDAVLAFASVFKFNPDGADVAFDFLVANIEGILKYFTSMRDLNAIVSGLANRFAKVEQIEKLKKIINTTTSESLKFIANYALNIADDDMKITQVLEKELSTYFQRKTRRGSVNQEQVQRKESKTSRGSVAATLDIKMVAGMVIVWCYFSKNWTVKNF